MAEQNKDPIPNPEANKSVAPTDKRYLLDMPDWIREFLAEFLGTFLQLHLLNSALMLYYIEPTSAVRLYSDPTICSEPSHESTNRSVSSCSSLATPVKGRMRGDIQYDVSLDAIFIIIIAFAWGAGHMVGLLVSMPVSGGFLNPAISLALASLNLMPRRKLLNLIPAQYLGSFFSAFMIHIVYWNHIYVDDEDRPDIKEKIIKFVMISAPHPSINMMTAILDSFLSSGIFSMFVFAILDEQSNKVKLAARPLLLTLTLIGIVMAFFSNSGVRLSPARDLGMRLYGSFILGFDTGFGQFDYCFWWLPQQVVLYLGFLIGGWFYVYCFGSGWKYTVSKYWPGDDQRTSEPVGVIRSDERLMG